MLKEVKPSPDSKILKLLTSDNLFLPTTTFLLKLVVEWRRLSLFPAKITLVHAWAIPCIEKISYSNSSWSQNLKLSNKRSGYDITLSAPQWQQLHSPLKRRRLECQTKGLRLKFINSALEWQASISVFTVTDYFVVANYVLFLIVACETSGRQLNAEICRFTIFPTCGRLVVCVCLFGNVLRYALWACKVSSWLSSPPCLDLIIDGWHSSVWNACIGQNCLSINKMTNQSVGSSNCPYHPVIYSIIISVVTPSSSPCVR